MNTNGSGFVVLTNFPSRIGVTLAGDALFGVSYSQIFSMFTNGGSATILTPYFGWSGDARGPNGLVVAGDTVYGITGWGGESDAGTIFRVKTDGSDYTILKHFPGGEGVHYPTALAIADGTLYGTALGGTDDERGILFKINTDGTEYAVLHSFAKDTLQLTVSGGKLYGTTGNAIFRINTDGSDFVVSNEITNRVVLRCCGDAWYGVTDYYEGYRTLFKVNLDGSAYSTIRQFGGSDPVAGWSFTPVRVGSNLYGPALLTNHTRAFVRVSMDRTDLEVLAPNLFSSLFAIPNGILVPTATGFYAGVNSSSGVLLHITTNGIVSVVHTFPNDVLPGTLVPFGDQLYGAASGSGDVGEGLVFCLNLQPRLAIAAAPPNVIIKVPSYASDYSLEWTTNLADGYWTPLATTAEDMTNRSATISASSQSKIFRLRK